MLRPSSGAHASTVHRPSTPRAGPHERLPPRLPDVGQVLAVQEQQDAADTDAWRGRRTRCRAGSRCDTGSLPAAACRCRTIRHPGVLSPPIPTRRPDPRCDAASGAHRRDLPRPFRATARTRSCRPEKNLPSSRRKFSLVGDYTSCGGAKVEEVLINMPLTPHSQRGRRVGGEGQLGVEWFYTSTRKRTRIAPRAGPYSIPASSATELAASWCSRTART